MAKKPEHAKNTDVYDTGEFPSAFLPALYCFDLSATVEQRYVGEIHGAHRVDLDYSAAKNSVLVRESSILLEETKAHLTGARLLSGNDWVLIDETGLAAFDTRFTLALNPEEKGCLLEGRIRGRTDLRMVRTDTHSPRFADNAPSNEVVAGWKGGFRENSYIPLILSVVFDVPVSGFDQDQTSIYRGCRDLGRTVFLGVGQATYASGPNSPITTIQLKLYRLGIEIYEHLSGEMST